MTMKERNILQTNDIDLDMQALRLSDADLQDEGEIVMSPTYIKQTSSYFIPLDIGGSGGTHKPFTGPAASLIDEVPLKKLQEVTELFLRQGIPGSHSRSVHSRFTKWIKDVG